MKIIQEAQKRLVIFNKLSLSNTHTIINRPGDRNICIGSLSLQMSDVSYIFEGVERRWSK